MRTASTLMNCIGFTLRSLRLRSRPGTTLLLLALASAAGCERSVAEPEKTIVLRIEGTVRSENTGVPIPGATVELLRSSGFSTKDAIPRATVVTDSQGRYAIEDMITVTVKKPSGNTIGFGCSSCTITAGVRASAAGYETSNVEDPLFHVGYSEFTRQIDIPLKPLNR